jgi:hypothetical protein
MTLIDVVLWFSEIVADELERSCLIEVFDREHELEDTLQPGIAPGLRRRSHLQKLPERTLLQLDQIRDPNDLPDLPETVAQAKIARNL